MQATVERVGKAIAATEPEAQPFALLRIGVDNFAALERSLTPPGAESLLALAGERLQANIRSYEMVVRMPGPEFAVLLQTVHSVLQAGAAADRLCALLHQPFHLDGRVVHLTACLGLAIGPDDGTQAGQLLERAGAALDCARASGDGVVQFFEPGMEEPRSGSRPPRSNLNTPESTTPETTWPSPLLAW